jgi:hypothetical protein
MPLSAWLSSTDAREYVGIFPCRNFPFFILYPIVPSSVKGRNASVSFCLFPLMLGVRWGLSIFPTPLV